MSATKVTVDGWSCDRILGTGGFGTVQLWIHPASGRKFAIKKCKWDVTKLTEIQKKRWFHEVQIMSQLYHPNIVRAVQIPFKLPDEDPSLPVLCMEYCKKGDLRKILNKPENCCGVSEQEAVNVMKNVSSAVEYLHNHGITHRDLKPENIVLQDEKNLISYKLIDLGYAKEMGETSTSASIVGTLYYVAPELLWRKKYSCSVDYWSLGILFYELITGSRPFLPNMQQPLAWMQHIKNKEYNDIRAYELNGHIVFGKNIEEPTQISRCFKERLVEWFRIVLQWESRERGKVRDEKGTSHLVVFKLLMSILSRQIVRVFYISLYKIEAYEIYQDTTVADLQKLIENDYNVRINEQVLTDYFGKRLIAGKPLLSQIHDPVLFLFKNGGAILTDIPAADIPVPLSQMLTSLERQLAFDSLKNFYRLTIFFMKQEADLFKLYIFALSINLDLLISRLNVLNENIKIIRANISDGLKELHNTYGNEKAIIENGGQVKTLEANQCEIKILLSNAERVKDKVSVLIDKNLNNMWQLYRDACNTFERLKKAQTDQYGRPNEIMKLTFGFLRVREAQFESDTIVEITQQVLNLESKVRHLEATVASIIAAMVHQGGKIKNKTQRIFRSDIANISNEVHNDVTQMPSINHFLKSFIPECNKFTESDDIIYDNLIMRSMLNNLLLDMRNTMHSDWMNYQNQLPSSDLCNI